MSLKTEEHEQFSCRRIPGLFQEPDGFIAAHGVGEGIQLSESKAGLRYYGHPGVI